MGVRQDHKEAERREEVKFNIDNVHLLQVQSVGEGGCSVLGTGTLYVRGWAAGTLCTGWTALIFCVVTQVEERQFREYADKVIAEAESRGANTQPLRKAAKAGAGR